VRFAYDGRYRDLDPLLDGPIPLADLAGRAAALQSGGAVEGRTILCAGRLRETSPTGVGRVAEHAPDGGAIAAGLAGAGSDSLTRPDFGATFARGTLCKPLTWASCG
jgi:hypothetical protein